MQALANILKAVDAKIDVVYTRFGIKNARLKILFSVCLFILALNILYTYVGVYARIHERPCSVHSSAQCQRASVAMNYYKIDMNFFKPRIMRYYQGDGVTNIEFPIVYYTGAVLYKLFGFNETYLRVISLLIASSGFLLFYLLVNSFVKNSFVSLGVFGVALLSPVLLYYSPNIMPDMPAFGFTLMGWYFFFKYLGSHKKSHLNLFVLFAALGALIKIISILCFVVIICVLIINRFRPFKNKSGEELFGNAKRILIRVVLGTLVVAAWYVYTAWIGSKNNNMSFAMQPWIVNEKEVLDLVLSTVRHLWLFQYYAYESYVMFACALAFIIIFIRKANPLLLCITILYTLGSACYAYLFLYQFKDHDYYAIAIMPSLFFLMLTFGDCLMAVSRRYSKLLLPGFIIIVFFNMKESVVKCQENYTSRYENKLYFGGDYRSYYDIEPRLRAMGIKREDKIISVFDDSYTSSLYFMNQVGFTIPYEADTVLINHILSVPDARYLIVNDSARFNKIHPNNFADKIIMVHRGLILYKLR